LQVIVGAGGTGVAGDDGNPDSPSFVGLTTDPDNALVLAAGGSGGTGNTVGGSPAGGTGVAIEDSVGQTRIAGGDGGDGATGKDVARAPVGTVPMVVVRVVLRIAGVLQTAIPEIYPVAGEEEHGLRQMEVPMLAVLVLPGKS